MRSPTLQGFKGAFRLKLSQGSEEIFGNISILMLAKNAFELQPNVGLISRLAIQTRHLEIIQNIIITEPVLESLVPSLQFIFDCRLQTFYGIG